MESRLCRPFGAWCWVRPSRPGALPRAPVGRPVGAPTRGVAPGSCISPPGGLMHCFLSGDHQLSPNVSIDNILQHLLPSRPIRLGVALLQHVLLQLLETSTPLLNLLTHASVPGAIAVLHKILEHAISPNLGRDLQSVSERIHAADVGMEQVDRLKALAPYLGIEVDAAWRQAALTENHQHALRR